MIKNFLYKSILSLFTIFITACTIYASEMDNIKQSIINQAKAIGVEPAIVLSIAKTESGFNQNARGNGGHIGVFQLSHSTAKHLGVNPYNVDENIKGGIMYFKSMYDMFGSIELAVAAYNVGPGTIKRSHNTVPNYTKSFVTKIMADYKDYKNSGL